MDVLIATGLNTGFLSSWRDKEDRNTKLLAAP